MDSPVRNTTSAKLDFVFLKYIGKDRLVKVSRITDH